MLFKDSAILKQFAQLSGTHNFIELSGSLRMVEQKYIVPILGKALYEELETAYKQETSDDPLSEADAALLYQCRLAIGPLFCFHHADKVDVVFTSSGMKRSESETNKTAYQEQRTKFKEANRAEGEEALEQLIAFLEYNCTEYTTWTDSENFKKYRSLFIKTGSEFNDLFPSQTPHRNYWAMRNKMIDVEEIVIRKFLGSTLYDALKTKSVLVDPGFTDEETSLMYKIKKAIANYAVAFSIPTLNVQIGSNGITVPAVTVFSTDDIRNAQSAIDTKSIDALVASCTSTANDWINNATDYLNNHANEFEDWIGFAAVIEKEDTSANADRTGNVFGIA